MEIMENLITIERNEIFDLAYRFVTETSENIFLTGKAGTGKTTFLKFLKDNCSKNVIVAAPTGVAAINAGGVTLHSLFQLPFHPFIPTARSKEDLLSKLKYNSQRQQLLRKMELLVIDEISMVRCDVIDALDTILRSVRRRHDLPFGGVQLLCIGDLYQLPPVAPRNDWGILQEYYPSPFFFDSNVIREQMPLLIELTTIYRQKEHSFVNLLNKVRNNYMDADDFEDLHMRYIPDFRPGEEEKYITLTSHNNQADQINARELNKLLAPSTIYSAIIEGDFAENNYPAEGELVLKEGAQVMFLKNDVVGKKYFNGKIGVVKKLFKEEILIDCDGEDIYVMPETWENNRYVLNRDDGKLEQENLGSFTQFPLRLAWAITIHKSQGLTFERVMIDAGAAFSSGQVYVALSRCTSLEGIVLLSKIPAEAIYSNENVIKGQQSLTHKGSLAERFAGARQVFTQQLLEEVFSFKEVAHLTQLLQSQVKAHQDKLNKEAVEWASGLNDHLRIDERIGLKFSFQIAELMHNEPEIEKNELLQERINAAANHFEPKFTGYLNAIKKHPLITEHREVATEINKTLAELILSVYTVTYYLDYCKEPFSVTQFLKHKLKFETPKWNINCYASGKSQATSDGPNAELYDTLRRWRDIVVEENNVPIFMVASHASLKEIAEYLPLTKKDLMKINGFGKVKADKYGDDILDTVVDYCFRHGIETNMHALKPAPKPIRKPLSEEVKTDTKTASFNLYKEGKTIAEIAKERSLAISTIEGHLSFFVISGEIDINVIVSEKTQSLIKEAIKIHGTESSKTLKDNLPEDVSYGEIRLMIAKEKSR